MTDRQAGLSLIDRVRIDRRATTQDDGAGNTLAGWYDYGGGIVRAQITELRGNEQVLADKLTGRQPCEVVLRSCAMSRGILADDRVIDLEHNNRVLNVRHVNDPGRHGLYVTLLCEGGVADG